MFLYCNVIIIIIIIVLKEIAFGDDEFDGQEVCLFVCHTRFHGFIVF